MRKAVDDDRLSSLDGANCVANLSCVYDLSVRDIVAQITRICAAHHDMVLSTLQTPLDHDTALSSITLKGPTSTVRGLAERIGAERGVRFARLNLISVEPNDRHHHRDDHEHHGNDHLSPRPG